MHTETANRSAEISTLNEKPLHAALKKWYARPGDRTEVSVGSYIVDVVQNDLLVEIQTRNFAAVRRKLTELTAHHKVRLVYPIAKEKWILKLAADRLSVLSRRRSPKRGSLESVFRELVSFPKLLLNPNFSLHLLLIQEEEVRRYEGLRSWRRNGWVVYERRLLRVLDQQLFSDPSDLIALIPPDLDEPFTTSDLAAAISKPRRLAQQMAYCLREMGIFVQSGKRGNAFLYTRAPGRDKRFGQSFTA